MRLLWLCRWSGASLVKMYSLEVFFFLLCGERQRLEDREGKIIQIEKYWAGKWSVINYWSSWTSRFFISERVLCCGIVVEFRYFILNAGLSGTFFYYCVITQVDDLKAPSTTVWISLRWETCRCHRQCFPLLPVCDFRRPRASLKALKGRKRSIHWPDETTRLFSRLLPSFFFLYRLLCLTSLNRSLEKPFSRHTRLCVFFTKITGPSFKAAFWGGSLHAARWQCYHMAIQEMWPSSLASKHFCDCAISAFPYQRVYTRLWSYTVVLQIKLRACFNQRGVWNGRAVPQTSDQCFDFYPERKFSMKRKQLYFKNKRFYSRILFVV